MSRKVKEKTIKGKGGDKVEEGNIGTGVNVLHDYNDITKFLESKKIREMVIYLIIFNKIN